MINCSIFHLLLHEPFEKLFEYLLQGIKETSHIIPAKRALSLDESSTIQSKSKLQFQFSKSKCITRGNMTVDTSNSSGFERIEATWAVNLEKCVDASPLIIIQLQQPQ